MSFIRFIVGAVFLFAALVFGLLAAVGIVGGVWPTSITLSVLAVALVLPGLHFCRRRKAATWRDDPATDKQKSFADDLGVKYSKGISKGELSDLIEQSRNAPR